MALRTAALVIADSTAEISGVDVSAPVVVNFQSKRMRVKNGSWLDLYEDELLSGIERTQRVFTSQLARIGTFLLISGTAYFVYLGRTTRSLTPKFVEFQISTAGAGAQTAEVGLFSSPTAPSKAAQSLTKLISSGVVDSLASTGVKRNSTPFSTVVAVNTHLWAGIRTAMATTQPTLAPGLAFDKAQGNILVTAAAAALTGSGPWGGALTAIGTNPVGPDLTVTLD